MPKTSLVLRRKANLFLTFSILWALLLSLLALQPEEQVSFLLPFPFMSTAGHAVAYFILSWLLCIHYRLKKVNLSKLFLLSILLSGCWGIINESLQFFEPSRVPDWRDVVTNIIGAMVATIVFVMWRKVKFR